jgi:hypothetical protein
MKSPFSLSFCGFLFCTALLFYSCKKQNFLRSESEVKKELQGTWDLLAIPKYDTVSTIPLLTVLHVENWTFNETQVFINIESQSASLASNYTVHTSATKAEIKVENVADPHFTARYNGTWQIVRLDENFLAIANDREGTSGLLQLEFKKKK